MKDGLQGVVIPRAPVPAGVGGVTMAPHAGPRRSPNVRPRVLLSSHRDADHRRARAGRRRRIRSSPARRCGRSPRRTTSRRGRSRPSTACPRTRRWCSARRSGPDRPPRAPPRCRAGRGRRAAQPRRRAGPRRARRRGRAAPPPQGGYEVRPGRHAVRPRRHGRVSVERDRRDERPRPERRAAGRHGAQAADRRAAPARARTAGARHARRPARRPRADAAAPRRRRRPERRRRHGVSPSLAAAIAWQESGFNNGDGVRRQRARRDAGDARHVELGAAEPRQRRARPAPRPTTCTPACCTSAACSTDRRRRERRDRRLLPGPRLRPRRAGCSTTPSVRRQRAGAALALRRLDPLDQGVDPALDVFVVGDRVGRTPAVAAHPHPSPPLPGGRSVIPGQGGILT